MNLSASNTLLLFCDNLLIQTRIESVFEKSDFNVVLPETDADFPDAALAILEIDEAGKWISVITRLKDLKPGLPVICFGPHVNRGALNAAKESGAKMVLPRSKFMAELASLPAVVRSW